MGGRGAGGPIPPPATSPYLSDSFISQHVGSFSPLGGEVWGEWVKTNPFVSHVAWSSRQAQVQKLGLTEARSLHPLLGWAFRELPEEESSDVPEFLGTERAQPASYT